MGVESGPLLVGRGREPAQGGFTQTGPYQGVHFLQQVAQQATSTTGTGFQQAGRALERTVHGLVHLQQTDLVAGSREREATVRSAHGMQQAGMDKPLQHLRQVGFRDAQGL